MDQADYARIGSGDSVETVGLADLLQGQADAQLRVKVTKRDGDVFEVPLRHTMSPDQLHWLRAGSALNYIRSQMA